MAPNCFIWLQLAAIGFKWLQMAPNGTKWHQMAPNGTKWHQLAQSDNQTVRARAELLRGSLPPTKFYMSWFTCQVSCVMFHKSRITRNIKKKLTTWLNQSAKGLLSTRPTLPSFDLAWCSETQEKVKKPKSYLFADNIGLQTGRFLSPAFSVFTSVFCILFCNLNVHRDQFFPGDLQFEFSFASKLNQYIKNKNKNQHSSIHVY